MRKLLITLAAVAVFISGCASMNKQQKGTIAGAAGGAMLGAAVSKGSIWGILAGAAVGGLAGNLIGKRMDQQAKELQQTVPTAQVERVGEGIDMTFNSGLLFALNSFELNVSYDHDLAAAAGVFVKYPDTNIVIEGHTDDTGTDTYNQILSEKRAHAVAAFLISKGVDPKRISEKGYGENQPKYPNDSEANRAKNRRVELAIFANEKMKKDANEGKLQ